MHLLHFTATWLIKARCSFDIIGSFGHSLHCGFIINIQQFGSSVLYMEARPSVLHQHFPPVETVIGAVSQRQDGRVDQLPHPTVSHFFTGTEAQIRNLHGPEYTRVTSWMEKRMKGRGAMTGTKLTFRTTWTKSLEFCGVRPCIWRVQASSEEACATIRTVFPVHSGGEEQRAVSDNNFQHCFWRLD